MPLYIPEDTTEDGVRFRIHIEQDSEVDYRTVIIFSGTHNEVWVSRNATKIKRHICVMCRSPWGIKKESPYKIPLPPGFEETANEAEEEITVDAQNSVMCSCGHPKSRKITVFPIVDELADILKYDGYSEIFGRMGSRKQFVKFVIKNNEVWFERQGTQKRVMGASPSIGNSAVIKPELPENGNGFSPTPLGQEPQVNYEDNTSTATMLPPPGRESPKKWIPPSRDVPVKVGLGAKEIRNLKDLFDNVMLELNIKVTPAMTIKVKNLIHQLEGAYKLVERGNAEALAINQFIMWIEKEIYFNKNVR